MISRALRGLRGRLLLALVATSAVTLAIAAAVTLSPLRERLRTQSEQNLLTTVDETESAFADGMKGLTAEIKAPSAQKAVEQAQAAVAHARTRHEREKAETDLAARQGDLRRALEDRKNAILDAALNGIYVPANEVRDRTDARVLILDPALRPPPGSLETSPAFLYDNNAGSPQAPALMQLGLQALNTGVQAEQFDGDDLTIATPIFNKHNDITGVVVTERRLAEVSAAVGLVRNALFAAAAVGLAVAVGLGLALSGTLTRRLGRLRRAALRITTEGPEAPTLRDESRDEVGDLARALARMQEELRKQETARRSFVSTASHELRTPLTMLQGTMELLDEDLSEGIDIDDAKEQVSNARRELRRLSTLASELLDLSRLDAAVQLRSEPVELGELARAVGAEFSLRAAERDVTIEVVPPPEPCWARGDPAACARVVRILIDNALRYAPPGEPIVVITERIGRRIVVEVADRGPGVPEEERERIFERFHRGRSASVESGFGLGLAIGRELADRMGGTLLLEDSDVGATFQLALPAASGTSQTPSPAPDSAAAA